MLSWKVVDKDDHENADGTEGLSVTLIDSNGSEDCYTVDQATFDALRVGESYTLSLTPIAAPVKAADAATDVASPAATAENNPPASDSSQS